MVRMTEIKIMPEVSGRIADLPVKSGERVEAGAVIARLSNPELSAAVGEAEAALLEAKAARDRVYAGVRKEQVGIAAKDIDKANADLRLGAEAVRPHLEARRRRLCLQGAARQGNRRRRQCDAVLKAAKSQHTEAETGPTPRGTRRRRCAGRGCRGRPSVLQRRAEKLEIHAPTAGMVETVVGELGEATVRAAP